MPTFPKAEQCIAWRPIPASANWYMVLEVERLEHDALAEGTPLQVWLISAVEGNGTRGTVVSRYCITFRHVTAFRFRPIDQPPEGAPVAMPRLSDGRLEVATWEVIHSRWLPEALGMLHSAPQRVHHYVIASSYVLFEIAAEYWETSEQEVQS